MNFVIKYNDYLDPKLTLFPERGNAICEIPHNCKSQFRFDFFILAQAVNYIDRLVLRKDTKDGWTRNLSIIIPVHNLTTWNDNKKSWEKLLTFLTGDRWSLSFYPTEHPIPEPPSALLDSRPEAIISLLSGGLDSYIGAIDLLESNQKVFFSNSGEPTLSKNVFNHFNDNYSNNVLGYKNHHIHKVKGENTQRARSLLFLANALIDIDNQHLNGYQVTKIVIPENGFIGINLPLSFARFGSASTKTAHPYYLEKLEELWRIYGLNISLQNPYQLKTKGEMLVECGNQPLLKELIPQTMSCAHPKKLVNNNTRYHSGKQLHCAHCWPCLIRRSSILHYQSRVDFVDNTQYVDLTITSKGVSQKDLFILERFLNSSTSSVEDTNKGSFYIRVPKMTNITSDMIQELFQRGIMELQQLFDT